MRIRRVALSFGAVVIATAAFAPAARASQGETASHGAAQRVVSSSVRGGTPSGVPGRAKPTGASSLSNGISYHGGPVMTAGVNA